MRTFNTPSTRALLLRVLALIPILVLVAVSCNKNQQPQTVAVTGVSLDKQELTLPKGQTAQLTATVLPQNATNKAFTFSSDNPEIARVDSQGLVTAAGEGNTTIRVKTEDGGFTASCALTVVPNEIVVQGVTVEPATLELKEGESATLKASVLPAEAGQGVEWASQNPEIATVNAEGLVRAVKEGSTRIYARSVASKDKQAVCEVTVVQNAALKGISFDVSYFELEEGQSRTLNVIFDPDYAANKKVSWATSNAAVATVEDGLVKAVKEGEATITATSEEGGFQASCQVKVVKTAGLRIYSVAPYWDIFLNGAPDPASGTYEIDGHTYVQGYAVCSQGNTLYSVEIYSQNHTYLCINREPKWELTDYTGIYFGVKSFAANNGTVALVFTPSGDSMPKLLRVRPDGSMDVTAIIGSASWIVFPQVGVAPDGSIYVVADIEDSFGDYHLAQYVLGPASTTLSETLFTDGYTEVFPSIDISEEGDVYCAYYSRDIDGLYGVQVLKNGEPSAVFVPQKVEVTDQNAIQVRDGHVYTAVLDRINQKIYVNKDKALYLTVDFASDCSLADGAAMAVSSEGDVYLSILRYEDPSWGNVGLLYKNDQILYTDYDDSLRSFCIVE